MLQVDGALTGAAVAAGIALVAVGMNYFFGSVEKEDKRKMKA